MTARIIVADVVAGLNRLEAGSAQCVVTSPPYWGLRDYGVAGQLGLERTIAEYLDRMVHVFEGVARVMREDGTLWLNMGDSYNAWNANSRPGGSIDSPGDRRNSVRPRIPGGYGLTATDLKSKDLVGMPWRLAFALQAAGWYLRRDIIEVVELYCPCGCGFVLEERVTRYARDRDIVWEKPNPMPESASDRPTTSHEYLFLLTRSDRYYYDGPAIAEPRVSAGGPVSITGWAGGGRHDVLAHAVENPTTTPHKGTPEAGERTTRNKRSVWTIASQPYAEAHFATFPEALVEPCIMAGSRIGDTVLDPFAGSGTTGLVADRLQRHFIGIELNPEYAALAKRRLHDDGPLFADVQVDGGTEDRGPTHAPAAVAGDGERPLGAKGSAAPDRARSSAGARMGRGAGWRAAAAAADLTGKD